MSRPVVGTRLLDDRLGPQLCCGFLCYPLARCPSAVARRGLHLGAFFGRT